MDPLAIAGHLVRQHLRPAAPLLCAWPWVGTGAPNEGLGVSERCCAVPGALGRDGSWVLPESVYWSVFLTPCPHGAWTWLGRVGPASGQPCLVECG